MSKTLKDKRLRAQRAIARTDHFESGGTLEGWRGRHDVAIDRRREASRRACRTPFLQEDESC